MAIDLLDWMRLEYQVVCRVVLMIVVLGDGWISAENSIFKCEKNEWCDDASSQINELTLFLTLIL